MKKIIATPRSYVQGPGVMNDLGALIKPFGGRTIVFWDAFVEGLLGQRVLAGLESAGMEVAVQRFGGEATLEERARLAMAAKDFAADSVLALGGGKTLDTAKGSAFDASAAMVSCPTVASTDAPTSACAVWYDAEGNYAGYEMMPFNPDMVVVDTEVIVQAPVRMFVAGMGDALATWVEADVCRRSRAKNFVGGYCTEAALAWAKLSFDILMEFGVDAKRDVENHLVTPAVEKVVEANVLLSGVGYESVGLACAHDIGNQLANFHECHEKGIMHGEKVAFGILAQLCLDENTEPDFRMVVLDFLVELGLPVTLAELGLEDVPRQRLIEVIGNVCASPAGHSQAHSFPITAAGIVNAMFAADALGRERLGR